MLLLEGAKRGGASTEELLNSVGIPLDLIDQEEARIDKHLFTQLMLEVMHQTQDEFMGFGVGRKAKPGTFSMMAHAVINCASLEKAMLRGSKFYELFNPNIFSRLYRQDDEACLRYLVRQEFEFQNSILEAVVFLTIRFLSWLIGQQIVPKKICFDFPCEDGGEFASQFSCPVFYNQSHTEIIFDERYLKMPLVQNALSLSKFLKSSLRELMEGDIENASLNARIRSIISKEFGNNFPDFSVICDKLNMTPQTLRRRLKDENTSYQEIKDSIRKDASVFYLSKHELTIDEIAMLMGFSEASSFHRAFKKWTGKTPSVYRQELLDQAEGR